MVYNFPWIGLVCCFNSKSYPKLSFYEDKKKKSLHFSLTFFVGLIFRAQDRSFSLWTALIRFGYHNKIPQNSSSHNRNVSPFRRLEVPSEVSAGPKASLHGSQTATFSCTSHGLFSVSAHLCRLSVCHSLLFLEGHQSD